MPELPEVERARALIEELGLGRRIAAVDDSDTYVCRPHAPGEIGAALEGRELTSANRRGKAMWCDTDGGPVLGLHRGMAGGVATDDGPDEHGWDRFTLLFEDGGRLALRDKRRLGRAVLDPDLGGVGPDAATISRDDFRARVGRGGAPIKARIMDQAAVSGVGNLLADESLWRARLSPPPPPCEADVAGPEQPVDAQRAAQVEVALGDRLDALDLEAHRGSDHLAGHLRAGGQRAEQQVARARRGPGAADPGVGLGLVDRPADVHRAGDRRVGLGPARGQRDARDGRVVAVALLERALDLAQLHQHLLLSAAR